MKKELKSSDFVRLEKKCGDIVFVYEFHTVSHDGGKWFVYHVDSFEEWEGHSRLHKNKKCTRESGNRLYTELKAKGYKYAGKYEMDIFGHKERKVS